jgi:hypothetical protein
MSQVSRRIFLKGAAAMPLAMWVARYANAANPVVRYDISSPGGAAMMEVYADAVRQMQAMGPDNPLSWMWQWYTHFVDGTTTKTSEITRIFGATVTPTSSLATEMWNTCQSHSGQNANNFLPWHRMFLFFFENIIRQVSGHPEFAVPYWNYISTDPALRGVVPPQFRLKDDATYQSLYRPNRTLLANSGQPIQKNQAGDPMDISTAMAKTSYSTVGTVQGFCRAIDSSIHGAVHVLVGTKTNMGAVPYAGRDPLFWVHHSSIDRMWVSWNANGGVNPTTAAWANKTFVFADAQGQRVSSRLRDYFDTTPLGYTYDALIPPAATTTSTTAATTTMLATSGTSSASSTGTTPQPVARAQTAAELGAKPVHVRLLPVAGAPRTAVLGLDPAQPQKHAYLVLKDLHAWSQPEVLYDVYLTPVAGSNGLARASLVGNINFFDAEFHDHGNGAMAEALGENFYSFDVTRILQGIARGGNPSARDALLVTLVPGGKPNAASRPLVATIELVTQ